MSINYHAEVARKNEQAAIARNKRDTNLSCISGASGRTRSKADTEACETMIDNRWAGVAESAHTTPFRLMDLHKSSATSYPEQRKEPALLSVSRYLRAHLLPIWYGKNVFTLRNDGPRGLEWWCRKIGKEKRSMLTGVEVGCDAAEVAAVRETLRRRYRLVFRDGVLQTLSDASKKWQWHPRG